MGVLMRIVLMILSIVSLAGCSKVAFKPIEKQATLKNSAVLTPNEGDGRDTGAVGGTGGNNLIPNLGNLPTGTTVGQIKFEGGETTQQTGTISNGNLQITVGRLCSDGGTFGSGTNAQAATSLTLQAINSSGSVVCSRTDTAQLKVDLAAGQLKFSGCTLGNGTYSVSLVAQNNSQLLSYGSREFNVAGGVVTSGAISVLLDSNPDLNLAAGEGNSEGGTNTITEPVFHNSTCDVKSSPLYVDFRKDTTQIDVLSSPQEGVMFDILGANGIPAYTKTQISWFNSAKFALLALPNSRGQVNGIDELFGNNTLGEDGKFAGNGFLALAKYDDNKDQIIDSQDAVYSQLRLWFDWNLNGRAEKGELVSLREKRLVAIDLDYDPNYYERDQYGNEIKFKSVVKFASGALRSIFDVWFKL
jgi:hypothetical protein